MVHVSRTLVGTIDVHVLEVRRTGGREGWPKVPHGPDVSRYRVASTLLSFRLPTHLCTRLTTNQRSPTRL